uniref:IS200/IS605 family transposase n=1 Tax=Brevibacillus laterosporus TaxID=1465 RepID=UPI002157FA2F
MALSRSVESNNNIEIDCKYHVVFCPKYRKKVLIEPVDVRLKELFLEKAQELRAEVVEMEIMPDHVHLLITCDPQFGIHRI